MYFDHSVYWILASASPRRRELMALLTEHFTCLPPEREEHILHTAPYEAAAALSAAKAEELGETYEARLAALQLPPRRPEDALVIIGADTVVSCEGRIFGKPRDAAYAAEMLRRLRGRTHEVYTGVTLLLAEPGCRTADAYQKTFSEVTRVTVAADLTDADIAAYIASGEPMDKAGAYGVQGAFAKYVCGIEGDYYNVVGFPVCRVRRELQQMRKMVFSC